MTTSHHRLLSKQLKDVIYYDQILIRHKLGAAEIIKTVLYRSKLFKISQFSTNSFCLFVSHLGDRISTTKLQQHSVLRDLPIAQELTAHTNIIPKRSELILIPNAPNSDLGDSWMQNSIKQKIHKLAQLNPTRPLHFPLNYAQK